MICWSHDMKQPVRRLVWVIATCVWQWQWFLRNMSWNNQWRVAQVRSSMIRRLLVLITWPHLSNQTLVHSMHMKNSSQKTWNVPFINDVSKFNCNQLDCFLCWPHDLICPIRFSTPNWQEPTVSRAWIHSELSSKSGKFHRSYRWRLSDRSRSCRLSQCRHFPESCSRNLLPVKKNKKKTDWLTEK